MRVVDTLIMVVAPTNVVYQFLLANGLPASH